MEKFNKTPSKKIIFTGKKFDLYITKHSCGSITYILDDLIEIGVNTIDPVQVRAHNMDFESLVKRYREKIVLQGSIDTQKTLPFGKEEDIKIEILSRINFFIMGIRSNKAWVKGRENDWRDKHTVKPINITVNKNIATPYFSITSAIHNSILVLKGSSTCNPTKKPLNWGSTKKAKEKPSTIAATKTVTG